MSETIKWLLVSCAIATISFIATYIITKNVSVSLVTSIVILIILIKNNPRYRYMKIGYLCLGSVLILQRFTFSFIGNILGVDIKLESPNVEIAVLIGLLLLAGYAFHLDLKTNTKSKKTKKSGKNQKVVNKGIIDKQLNITDSKGDINL